MSILFDLIPAKYRRLAYGLATLVLFVYGLWEASNKDWSTFVVSVLSSVVTALATANTVPVGEEAEPGVPDGEDDDDDEPVLGLPDIDYPLSDESAPDAEYPNSETLYQPGEKEGERFGDPVSRNGQHVDPQGTDRPGWH